MAEQGVVQLILPNDGSGVIAGGVGPLQLDVLAERLQAEYGVRATFEPSRFSFARWIAAKSTAERDEFIHAHPASVGRDFDGAPLFLAASAFDLKYQQNKWSEIVFSEIKDNWRNRASPLSSTDPHRSAHLVIGKGSEIDKAAAAPTINRTED
jgi:peptide chain release factor 3